MEQTVLITGASGVIGTALREELLAAGHCRVAAVSSKDADLRNEDVTRALMLRVQPKLVFHLAGRVHGIVGHLANKGLSYVDNVRINTNVVDEARKVGVEKIVVMGSVAVYSDSSPQPLSESSIWSGAPHPSEAAYAHAKRAMLAQLEAYREQFGLDFAFCVSTNLFGPRDKFDEKFGHVMPSLISKFHRGVTAGDSVQVWGSGAAERDFLYSKDAAKALRLIAETYSGSINLASGAPVTIRETVELLRRISNFQGEIVWDRSKPEGQRLRKYDLTKLRALGFKCDYSLEQGIKETFAWYAANAERARR